jgi:hypothetical protein
MSRWVGQGLRIKAYQDYWQPPKTLSRRPRTTKELDPVESACPQCGYIGPNKIRWQSCAGGDSRHLRLECGGCGRWKRFMSQTTEAIRKADLQGGLA